MTDLLYSLTGFSIGLLVGMTGVGGGSLLTPLLILLFSIHPATAVGTDLLYSAATKTAGSVVHGIARSIEWQVARRLAAGSAPSAMVTLALLSLVNQSQAARSLITVVPCGSLLMTAGVLIFRSTIVRFYRSRFPTLDDRSTAIVTVIVGVILGVLVTISSVGAGAIGVSALGSLDFVPTAADGQNRRVGYCACRAAHTHRRSRALDDRYRRSAYHRCAACRFVARHYYRQLFRRPRCRTSTAAIAGCDSYRCCREALIRSLRKHIISAHRFCSTLAALNRSIPT